MNIVQYIENNIELIDTDLNGFFINAYTDNISDSDMEFIIKTLETAEISCDSYRENALHYILSMQFECYQGEDTSLDNWIRSNLINYIGFKFEEIYNYIVENRTEFISKYLDIVLDSSNNYWRIKVYG